MKTSRRPVALLAVAAVSVLGLSACSSDPSAKRVAEDLVNTLAETDAERDCMLDIIDEYGADRLDELGNDVNDGDAQEQAAANAALDEFEAELAACRD